MAPRCRAPPANPWAWRQCGPSALWRKPTAAQQQQQQQQMVSSRLHRRCSRMQVRHSKEGATSAGTSALPRCVQAPQRRRSLRSGRRRRATRSRRASWTGAPWPPLQWRRAAAPAQQSQVGACSEYDCQNATVSEVSIADCLGDIRADATPAQQQMVAVVHVSEARKSAHGWLTICLAAGAPTWHHHPQSEPETLCFGMQQGWSACVDQLHVAARLCCCN